MCVVNPSGFGHLAKDMEKNSDEWYTWCNSEGRGQAPMPGDWSRMSEFKQLLLLRALRPDRVAMALQHFCESAMGARYVNQEAFSPAAVLAESSRCGIKCWPTGFKLAHDLVMPKNAAGGHHHGS